MNAGRTAWALWRRARTRESASAGYTVYLTAMVALVTIAPVVRAVWIVATDAPTATAVAPLASGAGIPIAVVAAWAAALAAGSLRGPVVMPPFLAHALATSPLPQRSAYAGRIWTPVAVGAGLGACAAAVLCLAWSALGLASPAVGVAATAAGAASGIVTAVLWLAGQVGSARAVAAGAAVLLSAAALLATTTLPAATAVRAILDVAWGSPSLTVALCAAAIGLVSLVPVLAARLDPRTVVAQSLRWKAATAHAGTLDLSGSAAVYQPLPRAGRGMIAIRGGPRLVGVVLRRDAVASARTPQRLAVGILALVACGVLLAVASAATPALSGLGAVAGVLAFAAAGAVTDGIRHVVVASSGPPLYGVDDLRLLVAHASFPALAALITIAIGVVLLTLLGPFDLWRGLAGVVPLALGAVMLRAMSALKPPLPTALLAPMSTPAGDMSALARVAWALDAVIIAVAIGITAPLITVAPWPAMIVVAAITAVTAHRWRRR